MTSDLRTAVESLMRLIGHAPSGIKPDVNGTYNQRVEAVFAALAEKGERAMCPICRQPESHHLSVWRMGNPVRECPVDPRSAVQPTSPPLPAEGGRRCACGTPSPSLHDVACPAYREDPAPSPQPGEVCGESCACRGSIRDGAHGPHSCAELRRNDKGEIVTPLPDGDPQRIIYAFGRAPREER